ncbi:hypothetical protein B296_00031846, partial [Ensete ventricosum]
FSPTTSPSYERGVSGERRGEEGEKGSWEDREEREKEEKGERKIEDREKASAVRTEEKKEGEEEEEEKASIIQLESETDGRWRGSHANTMHFRPSPVGEYI